MELLTLIEEKLIIKGKILFPIESIGWMKKLQGLHSMDLEDQAFIGIGYGPKESDSINLNIVPIT